MEIMAPKQAVIFDTNAYRYLVNGKSTEESIQIINKIRKAEEKKGIQAFETSIVAVEMLANLVEGETGVNHKDCLNGIIAMAYHCEESSTQTIRLAAPPLFQLANLFWGIYPQETKDWINNVAGIVNDFKISHSEAVNHHKSYDTFNKLRGYLDYQEHYFAKSIIGFIDETEKKIVKANPRIHAKQLRTKLLEFISNGDLEILISLNLVEVAAKSLNISLPEKKEHIKWAIELNTYFPVCVAFYRWMCHKIVNDKIDMTSLKSKHKRWNWMWDYQIVFSISDATLDNREVILVTSDKAIIEILIDLGYSNKVMTIDQYLKHIDIS